MDSNTNQHCLAENGISSKVESSQVTTIWVEEPVDSPAHSKRDLNVNGEDQLLKYLETRRGGKCLYYGGFKFHKVRDGPTNGKIYWRCEFWKSKGCPARCRGPASARLIQEMELTKEHHHPPNIHQRQVDELSANMRKRARLEMTPIPAIYREEIQKISAVCDPYELYEDLPSFTSVRTSLYRKRRDQQLLGYPFNPSDAVEDAHIPDTIIKTEPEFIMSQEVVPLTCTSDQETTPLTGYSVPEGFPVSGDSPSEEAAAEKEEDQNERFLLQPYNYILEVPGKSIRTKLTKAFNHWLNVSSDVCTAIGEVIQMLHNASLLIDDIQDNSRLRRGVPVAHQIFGVASTINAANYVYFLALGKLQQLGRPEVTQVFTEQLLELHRGQGMEIYWRDNFTCPTEEEYIQMVRRKTSSLFMLAVRLMQLFSDNHSDYTSLVAVLGIYFQIRDDYSNLKSEEYAANKSYCEDLTEGKFSFPIIHAIQQHPEAPQVLNIVRQRTKDIEIKKYAVDLLERLGSFQYTLTYMKSLDKQARLEIQSLGGNPHLVLVLDELKTW